MKAVALLSGGLDSILASRIIKDLGVELIAFNTLSPFCLCTHRSSSGCYHGAASAAKQLGLRFIHRDVSLEFLEIVKAPKHGYGSNLNPCIDCRIFIAWSAAVFFDWLRGYAHAVPGWCKCGCCYPGTIICNRPAFFKSAQLSHFKIFGR